jgi:hypothetical protein
MKKYSLLPLFLLIMTFSSCEIIGDIFKAGIWVGVIGVVLFVALIIWVLRKIF